MGSLRAAFTGSVLLALILPASASAHGLVQRTDLPIPQELFASAAAVVMVLSFAALAALWPKPRLEGEVSWRPLGTVGRVLGSRVVEVVCGAIGVALLGVVIWAGYAGAQDSQQNVVPTLIYVVFWVGLAFGSLLFGDIFRALNPWRALGRALRLRPRLPYPDWLGRWPAVLALLFFTWTELVGRFGDHPSWLATYAVVYTLLMLAGMAAFGAEEWSRRGEGFGVYFSLFARLSIFETRRGVVGVRPLLSGLPRLDPIPGTVAVVCVMIGTVTFDGASQGAAWKLHAGTWLWDFFHGIGFGGTASGYLAGTVGLLAGVALVSGFYALGIAGAKSVGGGFTEKGLRRSFVHTLVPIALVYVMAHYLTSLVFQGQAMSYLASDPLGRGWDLLGTASAGIDYGVLGAKGVWYLQVGFVVAGHVAGLVLAHDRALALYADAKQAVRSQYWMLIIMVGFTSLALWLLSQVGA